MTYSVCPITEKKALLTVSGVSKVDVFYERKKTRASFDDSKASVAKPENDVQNRLSAKRKPAENESHAQ